MAHIKISRGLDIPIKGKPSGKVHLKLGGEATPAIATSKIALNLDPFEEVRFKLHAKTGDHVALGQPLAEDKNTPGRMWVSPAAGVVSEIKRGLKRRLLDIVIKVSDREEPFDHGALDPQDASREEILAKLKQGGIFSRIRQRPFNMLADPEKMPKSIFVKAIESAPFVPPSEMQVEGHEEEFQLGLDALAKLTKGDVHLVYHESCRFPAFTQAKNVKRHTAEGPHPIGTHSVHIQHIDPIKSTEDIVWTLNAHDVAAIGHLLKTGHHLIERVISIAGPGFIEGRTGYFKVREGIQVSNLIIDRLKKGFIRLISGEPLTGKKVEQEDFLGYHHFALSAIPESTDREFLHFFRLGVNKYSFSKAYLSGHLNNSEREYDFTTNLHGEPRAFIEPSLYDKVNPLAIPTVHLVKAVMAEDFDLAEELGLLEVDSEDFALPTFVCPSKMEMTEIIKQGIKNYSKEFSE